MAITLLKQGTTPGKLEEVSVGFDMLSGVALPVSSLSGASTLSMNRWITCSGSTAYTVTLPTAVGNGGQFVAIRCSNTAGVTVAPFGTQMIDGSTTGRILFQGESAILMSDGAGWCKVGGSTIPRTFTGKNATTVLVANTAANVTIANSAPKRAGLYQINISVDGYATSGTPGTQYLSLKIDNVVKTTVGMPTVGNFFAGHITRLETVAVGSAIVLVPENYGTTTVNLSYKNGLELQYIEVPQW